MQGVFNPNILIYHPPNCAEGLHFSAFHLNVFSFLFMLFLCNIANVAQRTFETIKNRDHAEMVI